MSMPTDGNADPTFIISFSPEFLGLIDEIAGRMGLQRTQVIFRGIALLNAAVDSRARGMTVGAAMDAECLDEAYTGW